jgi:hypothetical protein
MHFAAAAYTWDLLQWWWFLFCHLQQQSSRKKWQKGERRQDMVEAKNSEYPSIPIPFLLLQGSGAVHTSDWLTTHNNPERFPKVC